MKRRVDLAYAWLKHMHEALEEARRMYQRFPEEARRFLVEAEKLSAEGEAVDGDECPCDECRRKS